MDSQLHVQKIAQVLLGYEGFKGLIRDVQAKPNGHVHGNVANVTYAPDIIFEANASPEDIEKFVKTACRAAHVSGGDIPSYVAASIKSKHLPGLSANDLDEAAGALLKLSLEMAEGKTK